MKAVHIVSYGPAEHMQIVQQTSPIPTATQVLVKVRAAGLNRADILQRKGHYPPPDGHSPIMGLEIAGDVVQVGADVEGIHLGQRVFGLVNGGAYAEFCVIDAAMCITIPDDWDYTYAAAIPEVFFTANETLIELGQLQLGETCLIHAAGSGVGTAGIQLAHYIGAKVFATMGSQFKIEKALALGVTHAINYKTHDFVQEVNQWTDEGVDVIQDFIGAGYFSKNLNLLKTGGRLIQVAIMSGRYGEINLAQLLKKRLQINGFILRSRTIQDKRAITHRFKKRWLPVMQRHAISPVIDSIFPFSMVVDAHRYMESNKNFGKIILDFDA